MSSVVLPCGSSGDQEADVRFDRGRRNSAISGSSDDLSINRSRSSGRAPNRRMESLGPSRDSGGIIALTRAVRQPGIDHRAGFVHAATNAGHDSLDGPEQMVVVREADVGPFQASFVLDEYVAIAIHQNVADFGDLAVAAPTGRDRPSQPSRPRSADSCRIRSDSPRCAGRIPSSAVAARANR